MNIFKKAQDPSQPVPVIKQCSIISRTVSMVVDTDDFSPYSISPDAFGDSLKISLSEPNDYGFRGVTTSTVRRFLLNDQALQYVNNWSAHDLHIDAMHWRIIKDTRDGHSLQIAYLKFSKRGIYNVIDGLVSGTHHDEYGTVEVVNTTSGLMNWVWEENDHLNDNKLLLKAYGRFNDPDGTGARNMAARSLRWALERLFNDDYIRPSGLTAREWLDQEPNNNEDWPYDWREENESTED